jgi:hypothetical protein
MYVLIVSVYVIIFVNTSHVLYLMLQRDIQKRKPRSLLMQMHKANTVIVIHFRRQVLIQKMDIEAEYNRFVKIVVVIPCRQ